MTKPPIYIIAGPTASGKSALALALAEKTDGVIINADSQQMYAELRILTARPSVDDEARALHRLYGTMPAWEPCSAGKWLRFAEMEIDWAIGAGKTPILVGGTGLYIRALTEGMAEIPDISPEIRAQAKADFDAMGREAFYTRLCVVDPEGGVKLRVSDTQRILRAYEVWLGTGKPISWWQRNNEKPKYNKSQFKIFHVNTPRDIVYKNCDERFRHMVNNGGMHEVHNLLNLKLSSELPAMRVIGVPELTAHLKGVCDLETAIAHASQATRNYAKRQMTWMRNQMKDAHPISLHDGVEAMLFSLRQSNN